MIGSALIVFREVLEAALIIGIVLAATQGISGRAAWVFGGVVGGLTGAVVVAFFAESIAASAEGLGQELFNAGILLMAVFMLGWHQVWMSRHGRQMAGEFKNLGKSIRSGDRTVRALALVVGLAILREGSEAVLFLFGVAASDGTAISAIAGGVLLGLVGGAICGGGLYFGLVKIPARLLFGITGWLIILLAAGMASQAAAFLVQAGEIPSLVDELWNSSGVLERTSPFGQVLHILVGYDDRPAGIQLVFYVATIFGIGGFSRWIASRPTASTT
jgi:high-affinity iron transporter